MLEGNTTPGASVKVDDADAVVTPDGKFVMPVSLSEGNNSILIAATKGMGGGGLRKRITSSTGGATG